MSRIARLSALGALLATLAAQAALSPAAAPAKTAFKEQRFPIQSGRLFDLATADYDGDRRQGLFTTNHSFLSALSKFKDGRWTDDLFAMGLSQSPEYPGFEDLLRPPKIDRPGLFLYAQSRVADEGGEVTNDAKMNVVAQNLSGTPLLERTARLRLTLISPEVQIKRSDGAQVHVSRDWNAEPPRTVVDVEIERNGHLQFVAKKLALPPIEVEIPQAPLRTHTYVGSRKIRARARSFTLDLRDRHGIAWGDVNGDGVDDAYITAGGVGGAIARRYKGIVDDELLLSGRGSKLRNSVEGSGLEKKACRGRMAALPDFDADGDLDIFSSCEKAGPKLWRQDDDGFSNVSKLLRGVGARGSIYRWADIDRRPGLELLVGRKRHLVVYTFRDGRFKRTQRARTRNAGARITSLALGDFNRDGRPDVFAASPAGNTLLVNRRGKLRPKRPASFGMPKRSIFATWVDVDNDGDLDLHSLPGGLYESRKAGKRFVRSGELRMAARTRWGVAAWWDFDGDGRRDVAFAGRAGNGPHVRTRFYRNRQRAGNWLHVDVTGPGGAAGSLGAKVELLGKGRRSRTGWVGQSESSRFSSGNYRLFFGLGKRRVVNRVRVSWPDGSKRTVGPVRANRLLTVERGGAG
jgi:hypothetical protein